MTRSFQALVLLLVFLVQAVVASPSLRPTRRPALPPPRRRHAAAASAAAWRAARPPRSPHRQPLSEPPPPAPSPPGTSKPPGSFRARFRPQVLRSSPALASPIQPWNGPFGLRSLLPFPGAVSSSDSARLWAKCAQNSSQPSERQVSCRPKAQPPARRSPLVPVHTPDSHAMLHPTSYPSVVRARAITVVRVLVAAGVLSIASTHGETGADPSRSLPPSSPTSSPKPKPTIPASAPPPPDRPHPNGPSRASEPGTIP